MPIASRSPVPRWPSRPSRAHSGRRGRSEIRVGFTQDALTLDPANPGNRDTETIIRNMYDGLLTRDPAMNVVPEIADSWHQVDPLTYEFHLRDGVHFHDGTPLTAEDVKFTIERVLGGKIGGQTNPRKDLLGPLSAWTSSIRTRCVSC